MILIIHGLFQKHLFNFFAAMQVITDALGRNSLVFSLQFDSVLIIILSLPSYLLLRLLSLIMILISTLYGPVILSLPLALTLFSLISSAVHLLSYSCLGRFVLLLTLTWSVDPVSSLPLSGSC